MADSASSSAPLLMACSPVVWARPHSLGLDSLLTTPYLTVTCFEAMCPRAYRQPFEAMRDEISRGLDAPPLVQLGVLPLACLPAPERAAWLDPPAYCEARHSKLLSQPLVRLYNEARTLLDKELPLAVGTPAALQYRQVCLRAAGLILMAADPEIYPWKTAELALSANASRQWIDLAAGVAAGSLPAVQVAVWRDELLQVLRACQRAPLAALASRLEMEAAVRQVPRTSIPSISLRPQSRL